MDEGTAKRLPSLLLSLAGLQGQNALGAWACVRDHFYCNLLLFVRSQSTPEGDKVISFIV